jgi:hypothetical protein
MITTAMALITYAYTLHVYLAIAMTALVAIVALLRAYGPSAITVADQFGSFWERVYGIVTAIIPQTATAWGVVSIVAAFALLGAGAYHTLRSRSVS